MVINMKITSEKGMSTVISTLVYILISIIILGVVTSAAIELISNVKEQSNYKTMLTTIENIKTTIENVVDDKKNIEFVVKSPGEVIIDCNNNIITGKIDYLGEYKKEAVIISEIVTYKNNNIIYFEYSLDNYKRLKLDCNSFVITNKTTINIRYKAYDDENDQILIGFDCLECKS